MAESGLDSLRETHRLHVTWRPYELRPPEAPPLPPDYEARYQERIRAGWPRVEQIARERFGLELKRREGGPRAPRTRLAHTGAQYAIEQGRGEAYHRAMFRAYWQELRDIGEIETLVAIARGVGLDEAAFRIALTHPRYEALVLEAEEWATRAGLGGVPAFILGNRYLVSGAQPAEVLREVAERCITEGLTESE